MMLRLDPLDHRKPSHRETFDKWLLAIVGAAAALMMLGYAMSSAGAPLQ